MRFSRTWIAAPLLLAVGCDLAPPAGTQIGALREEPPPPRPPSDIKQLDVEAAIAEAIALAGRTTLATAWQGHTLALAEAPKGCPDVWVGPLPEDADAEIDEEDGGLSWLADCTTPTLVTYDGWVHWTTELSPDGTTATRSLIGDARVTDPEGLLLELDGVADDSIDASAGYAYGGTFEGELGGRLIDAGSGLRGAMEARWSDDGTFRFFGSVTALDGFGPPDGRDPDPEISPELSNLPGWTPGMPRFTSVRFDLELDPACPEEPVGFVGIRGNEGFWLDVYFLPLYDPAENTAQSSAFPFEEIDNQSCDGIGTLFARNRSLASEEDETWSREVRPDFAAAIGALPRPGTDSAIFTLRHLPEE